MYNFLKTALLVAIIFGLTLLFYTAPPAQEVDKTIFVAVSADSAMLAGSRQDFAIYLLNPHGKVPVPDNTSRLAASLVFPTQRPLTIKSEAKFISEGAYTASFNIPDIALPPQAILEIRNKESGQPIFRGPAPTGRDTTLVVMPPPEIVYAGSWLSIRIATLCRKSGKGLFKTPVRAKLLTPAGQQTVNRVIHSDIDGMAVFTTHINNNAAGGIYKCELSHGREKVVLHLNIKSMSEKRRKRAMTIQNRDINPLARLIEPDMKITEPQQYYFARSLEEIDQPVIFDEVNLEKSTVFLSYHCPGSLWRQIEVWQNGRIHYTSDLQIESGRVSLSFKSPLLEDIPIKLKLWYLDQNGLKICEQTFYRAGEQQNPINLFFKAADRFLGDGGSTLQAARALAGKGFFADNQAGKVKISLIKSELEQTIEPEIPPAADLSIIRESPARLLSSDARHKPGRRFFLVKDEIQLSRYKFSNLRIWHHPRRLLGSLIGSLMLERANIAYLIGEAEIRSLRLQYMSDAERDAELEKLEGLLAPLSEFHEFCQSSPELKATWENGILRAAKRISGYISLPEKLATALKSHQINTDRIGPFSPVLPVEVALDELMPALKPGGRVLLTSNERQMPINLSGNVSVFSSRSFSGKDEGFEKLINTRSAPIVVELDFSSATAN
ncbi:MAG: hypothetical protein GX569_14950 [Candidatus Riflebacteria bacterium]|nr:hypothetical protein [Candidatus Riflebacteria bacterium]